MQILADDSENTRDLIHELWKRVTENSLLPVSTGQLDSALIQASTLWTQKPSGCPPGVFGSLFPGKDGPVLRWIRKRFPLTVERGGVGLPITAR